MGKHEKKVEAKVTAATIGTYIGGVLLTTLVEVLQDGSLVQALPAPWSAILLPLAPALVALLSGYLAPHTDRPEDPTPEIPDADLG